MAPKGHTHDPHAHGGGDGGPEGIGSAEHLAEHLGEVVLPSTVIVCVGNDLCGDDGAGPAVAAALAGALPWHVLDTQTVPESFLMKIVDRKPESVVLIDALDFAAPPGTVDLVDADRIGGQGPSTHGPAPLAFLDVLNMMHPCRRAVVGIQPGQTDPGLPISDEVARAVRLVVDAFRLLAERISPANGPAAKD